jgi:plasmid stabilization system protein ParE
VARRVAWTDSAWQELESAASFIARDSIRYAAALVAEARFASRSLMKFPRRGRVVPEVADERIRELFVKSYRLIYEVREDGVFILAFLHGARRFPRDLG